MYLKDQILKKGGKQITRIACVMGVKYFLR